MIACNEYQKKRVRVLRHIRRVFLIVLVSGILYLGIGAVFPFIKRPKITDETKSNLENIGSFSSAEGERARIITSNEDALEERIRLIHSAKEKIVLSTFDFESDISGKQVLASLLAAADRGVEVRVIVDGLSGLLDLSRNPYFYALSAHPKAQIKLYNPINFLTPWKSMGRMHDKYLIVDFKNYILGGRNTYDFFLGKGNGHINYDWDVFVACPDGGQRTTSAERLDEYFESVWNLEASKLFGEKESLLEKKSVIKASNELNQIYLSMKKSQIDGFKNGDSFGDTVPIDQIVLWTNPTNIYAKEPFVFYQMSNFFKKAKEEVVFHTPYIICDKWMLNELKEICNKDVTVTMMTNSVANNGNPFGSMDYYMNRDDILETGVQVLEYDGGISYHGKCFTMDQRYVGVGSFNWDMRSAYIDTEMMLVIDSKELHEQVRREMEKYENDAIRVINNVETIVPSHVTPQEIPTLKKVIMWVMRIFGGWARFLM